MPPQYDHEFDESLRIAKDRRLVTVDSNRGNLELTADGRLIFALMISYANSLGVIAPAPFSSSS